MSEQESSGAISRRRSCVTRLRWMPLKRIDAQRYRRGQPHLLDTHLPLTQLRTLLGQTERMLGSLHP
jgi:hypothetical protein